MRGTASRARSQADDLPRRRSVLRLSATITEPGAPAAQMSTMHVSDKTVTNKRERQERVATLGVSHHVNLSGTARAR